MKNLIIHWAWIGAILFGLSLIGGGVFLVAQGRAAHDDVSEALSAERIVTPADAAIPNEPVTGAAEAKAQADVIWVHLMEQTGGRTYSELARDDPLRATYLNAVTLRTALMESYLAFKIADLVMAIGLIVALLGGSQVVLGGFLGLVFRTNRGSKPLVAPVAAPVPAPATS